MVNIHNSAQHKTNVNGGALTFKTYPVTTTDGVSQTVLWLNSPQNGQPTLEIVFGQYPTYTIINFWCRINGTGVGAPTFKLVNGQMLNYYDGNQGLGVLNRNPAWGDSLTFAGWQNSNHDIYVAYADAGTNHSLVTIGYFPASQFTIQPTDFLMQMGGEVVTGGTVNPNVGMGSGIEPPNPGAASITGYTVDTQGTPTITPNTDYTYNNDCTYWGTCCYNIIPDASNINNILYGGPGNCTLGPCGQSSCYACSGNTCIQDNTNGTYTTSNCNNACVGACGQSSCYACSGSMCVQDNANGTYTTNTCNNACSGSNCTNCDLASNYCILGECIPHNYAYAIGAGVATALVYLILKL